MQKLVCVDERSDDDEGAENVPQPVGCGVQRGADFAHLPNVVNAEGDESKQKIFKQSTFGSETVLPDWFF